ncbi:hypothetical protein FRC12_000831 [Ceratobasidium sp. 428]|nr:hypothetical protein FRC12_000831 [Ceratobasidium sp. 428]
MSLSAQFGSMNDAEIVAQEQRLRFPSFNANDAFNIGSLIRAKFLARHLPYPTQEDSTISSISSTVSSNEPPPEWANRGIVISISTFTGHTLFACTVGLESEVTPDNWVWVSLRLNLWNMYGIELESRSKGSVMLFVGSTIVHTTWEES